MIHFHYLRNEQHVRFFEFPTYSPRSERRKSVFTIDCVLIIKIRPSRSSINFNGLVGRCARSVFFFDPLYDHLDPDVFQLSFI